MLNRDIEITSGLIPSIDSTGFEGKVIWTAIGKLVVLNLELIAKQEIASGANTEITSLTQFVPKTKTNFILSNAAGLEFYCFLNERGKLYLTNYHGKPLINRSNLYGQAILVKA